MAELDGIKRLQEESLEFSNNLDFIADKWKELSENERRDVLRNIRKHTRMENVLNVVQNTDFSSLSFFILTIIVVGRFFRSHIPNY